MNQNGTHLVCHGVGQDEDDGEGASLVARVTYDWVLSHHLRSQPSWEAYAAHDGLLAANKIQHIHTSKSKTFFIF